MLISDSNYIKKKKKKARRNQQDQEALHILEISLKAYSQMILKHKKGCICYEYYWRWIIHPAVLSSMRKNEFLSYFWLSYTVYKEVYMI